MYSIWRDVDAVSINDKQSQMLQFRLPSLGESIAAPVLPPHVYMVHFCSNSNEMHQFLKFILFCSNTLNVNVKNIFIVFVGARLTFYLLEVIINFRTLV